MQYNNISSTKINKQHQNTIMENRNENNYEKDDEHELSPLLLVPIDAAPTTKKSPGSKRFVALLLVSATAAAAAMTVLLYCSLITGVNPIVFPAVSSVFGTGRAKQQGEWCAGFWYAACDDNLSCFMSENSNYCVPNGQKNACCGSSWADVAAGIDCGPGLSCLVRLTLAPQQGARGLDVSSDRRGLESGSGIFCRNRKL